MADVAFDDAHRDLGATMGAGGLGSRVKGAYVVVGEHGTVLTCELSTIVC